LADRSGELMNVRYRELFMSLPDVTLLAMCIYAESRGEPYAGKCGVGHVVINRVKCKTWYGKGIKDVILKPWQFSCFNEKDPNFQKLVELAHNPPYIDEQYLEIADGCIDGYIPSPVEDATHYHNTLVKPSWIDSMKFIVKIGHHLFYREAV
jgi:spore germination cell wall hydrolase CwlJ-like protein